MKFIVLIATLACIFCCLIFSEEFIRENGQWLYLIQLIVISVSIFKSNNNYIWILSPSYLTILYLNFSFSLGHYVVSKELGFTTTYSTAFKFYESVSFITSFFLLCNMMVFLALPQKIFNSKLEYIPPKFVLSKFKIYPLVGLLVLFSFIEIDLSFLGGAGSFTYTFELATTIIIAFCISNFNKRIRYIYYGVILIIFTIGHYDSKREILFVVILFLFFEIIKNGKQIRLHFKQILFLFLGILTVFYLIIVSSIMRGYGSYNATDPLEASKHIVEYLSSDFAVNALVANFELSSVYGNSSNAVNYVYSGQVELLYGSTFTKFLFLPIPRSIAPDKPSSMVDIYTQKFSPGFRAIGGSYPIVIYSESFWNFSLLCLPFILIIFIAFNHLYYKTIVYIRSSTLSYNSVFFIFMYCTIIQFIRGSGFEIWLIYGVIPLPFTYILLKILKNKVK